MWAPSNTSTSLFTEDEDVSSSRRSPSYATIGSGRNGPTSHRPPPPPPHHPHHASSSSSSSSSYPSSSDGGGEDPQDLHQRLERLRTTRCGLRRYLRGLALLLAVLVTVLAVMLLVLHKQYPWVWPVVLSKLATAVAAGGGDALAPSSSSSSSSRPDVSGERAQLGGVSPTPLPRVRRSCASISEHLEGVSERCGSPSSSSEVAAAVGDRRGCSLDVETALCLLTKTKTDLDARTKRLDENVYRNSRQLEEIIPNRGRKNNISSVYSRRASAHLHMYYSHEYREQPKDGFEPLLWTHWQSGLSSVRGIDVTYEGGAIVNMRIRQSGFYQVYSQVTFKTPPSSSSSSADWDWPSNRPLHCLYKNYTKASRPVCRQALLKSYRRMGSAPISYVQGVFRLEAKDVLTVHAPFHLLNTSSKESTFFGAYHI